MLIRRVASRVAAFAFPLAAIAAGVPALNASVRAANRPVQPAAQPAGEELLIADSSPSPSPEATGGPRSEQVFDITLPQGWDGGEVFDAGHDATRTWRYTDDAGNFFVVNIDPAGTDFDTDQIWSYRVAGGSFEVTKIHTCAPGPDDPMCGVGDGRLDIFALSENGEGAARVGEHAWYFHFGNQTDEDAEAPWRDLLHSVRPIRYVPRTPG